MSKGSYWELKDAYYKAIERLKILEMEYEEAVENNSENVEECKERLLDQRKHVEGLAKIKNDREKNYILRQANSAENARNVIETVAVIPILFGAVKAVNPLVRRLGGIIFH